MKKRIKAMTVFLIAGVMMFSMAGGVSAETVVTAGDNGKVEIVNDLYVASGTEVPELKYTYTAESVSVSQAERTINVPSSVSPVKIEFSKDDTIVNDMVSGNAILDLSISKMNYPSAGVYEFLVKETCDSSNIVAADSGDGRVVLDQLGDANEYLVSVYVKNTDSGLAIYGVTAAPYDDGVVGAKVEKLIFTESYSKVLSSMTTLSINKTVKGEYADQTKKFDYTISFKNPSTVSEQTIIMTVIRKDSTRETGRVDLEGTASASLNFKLGHGDYVIFTDVFAGTTYTVTETAADGYTASYTQVAGGSRGSSVNGTTVGNTVLSDSGENSVSYVNTYKDITVTGVVMDNLPFVAMIVLAAGAFAVFTIIGIRRRKSA